MKIVRIFYSPLKGENRKHASDISRQVAEENSLGQVLHLCNDLRWFDR
jgi:hypothetical protein